MLIEGFSWMELVRCYLDLAIMALSASWRELPLGFLKNCWLSVQNTGEWAFSRRLMLFIEAIFRVGYYLANSGSRHLLAQ